MGALRDIALEQNITLIMSASWPAPTERDHPMTPRNWPFSVPNDRRAGRASALCRHRRHPCWGRITMSELTRPGHRYLWRPLRLTAKRKPWPHVSLPVIQNPHRREREPVGYGQ